MKTCFKCGLLLSLSEFYKHEMMADGHLNKCKECTKKDVAKHRLENLEKVRQYDRDRAKLPHRKKRCAEYAYMRNQDRIYLKAHNALTRAVRKGTIVIQPCEKCGRTTNVHAHHDDYNKPLDVKWLCPPCHAIRHKELKQQRKEVW